MPPSPAAVRAMFRAFLRTGTRQRVAWDREQETGKNETGEKRERGREKRLQIELFDHDGGRLSLENGGAKLTNTPLPAPSTSLPPFPPRRQLPQLQHPRVHPPPRQGALPRGSDSDRGDDGGGDGSRRGSSELARGPRVLGWPQGARGREEAGRARADVPQAAAVGDGRDEHRGAPEEGGRERGMKKRKRRRRRRKRRRRSVKTAAAAVESYFEFFFFFLFFDLLVLANSLFSPRRALVLLSLRLGVSDRATALARSLARSRPFCHSSRCCLRCPSAFRCGARTRHPPLTKPPSPSAPPPPRFSRAPGSARA